MDVSNLPVDTDQSLARFVYAFMSDVDVRTRWRAAHAACRLAALKEQACVDALFGSYALQEERTFRDPDAPFYWMAARLWLLIAINRIAGMNAEVVAKHGKKLFNIATDDGFSSPHSERSAIDSQTDLPHNSQEEAQCRPSIGFDSRCRTSLAQNTVQSEAILNPFPSICAFTHT